MLLLILALLGLFIVLYLALSAAFGVPWVPTGSKLGRQMFKLADLKPGEIVLDFGCGDGSLLLTAAKDFGAYGIGYDINLPLCWLARLRIHVAGVAGMVQIYTRNFHKVDLPRANVVVTYLLPKAQEKLEKRLIECYPSGTRVVCRAFEFPNLKLEKVHRKYGEKFYLYRIP